MKVKIIIFLVTIGLVSINNGFSQSGEKKNEEEKYKLEINSKLRLRCEEDTKLECKTKIIGLDKIECSLIYKVGKSHIFSDGKIEKVFKHNPQFTQVNLKDLFLKYKPTSFKAIKIPDEFPEKMPEGLSKKDIGYLLICMEGKRVFVESNVKDSKKIEIPLLDMNEYEYLLDLLPDKQVGLGETWEVSDEATYLRIYMFELTFAYSRTTYLKGTSYEGEYNYESICWISKSKKNGFSKAKITKNENKIKQIKCKLETVKDTKEGKVAKVSFEGSYNYDFRTTSETWGQRTDTFKRDVYGSFCILLEKKALVEFNVTFKGYVKEEDSFNRTMEQSIWEYSTLRKYTLDDTKK